MKVREIIALQVADLLGAGVTPRYLTLTARALEQLIKEVHADLGEQASLKLQQAEPTITYQDMEVIVAEMSRFYPIHVSGTVRDEMDFYNLKVRKK